MGIVVLPKQRSNKIVIRITGSSTQVTALSIGKECYRELMKCLTVVKYFVKLAITSGQILLVKSFSEQSRI